MAEINEWILRKHCDGFAPLKSRISLIASVDHIPVALHSKSFLDHPKRCKQDLSNPSKC